MIPASSADSIEPLATKVALEDQEVYVWPTINCRTFEMIHVKVSPRCFDLDALLFMRTVLERARGDPVIILDRGSWYY